MLNEKNNKSFTDVIFSKEYTNLIRAGISWKAEQLDLLIHSNLPIFPENTDIKFESFPIILPQPIEDQDKKAGD